MDARESQRAAEEARVEVTRRGQPSRYSEAALRYLWEVAYIEAHRPEPRRSRKPDDEAAGDAM